MHEDLLNIKDQLLNSGHSDITVIQSAIDKTESSIKVGSYLAWNCATLHIQICKESQKCNLLKVECFFFFFSLLMKCR